MSIGCLDGSIWDAHIANELYEHDREDEEEEDPRDERNGEDEIDKQM